MIREVPTSANKQRIAYWIAQTLREARQDAGISRANMASSLGVDQMTIKRLESGRSLGRDIDFAIAGYAYVIGIADSRELWFRALERWREHAAPPDFSPGGPPEAFARVLRETRLQQEQAPGEPPEKRRTKETREAGPRSTAPSPRTRA